MPDCLPVSVMETGSFFLEQIERKCTDISGFFPFFPFGLIDKRQTQEYNWLCIFIQYLKFGKDSL